MGTDHKKSSGSKKGLSAFEKAFAAARKKAGGPGGIFTFKTKKGLEKFTTAYKGEKIPKKTQEKEAKSSGVSKNRMMDFEPLGESKLLGIGAKKLIGDRDKANAKGTISLTIIGVGQKELPKKVEPKPAIRAHVDAIKNQRERRAWEEKYGANYNNDGTLKKTKKASPGSKVRKESRDKAKGMNVGGLTQSSMMNGLSRKINPATGLTMKKGGMIDYRKKGMFYGGGMARRGR
jgi:hypothetical protein